MNSQTIGDYLIKRTIGRGTFSKVKLAVNKTTSQKVAIKILEKSKIIEPDDLERIVREMAIIIEFNHPNVVVVHEIFETDEHYLIIMDYCSGGELFNYIVVNQRLEEDEASFFYYQLINGVEYIHSKNIVHRDLKPENLLLDEKGLLKIIDFGLSNFFTGDKLTTPCGSPCYASPEMVGGNKYNGFYIDVWSTGIILFAMICGYLPFEDSDNEILFKKILKCKVFYPSHVSLEARDLMKKILVTDPEKRIKIKEIKEHKFYLKGKKEYEERFGVININNNDIHNEMNDFDIEEMNYKNNTINNSHNKSNNESKMQTTIKTEGDVIHQQIKDKEGQELINIINGDSIEQDVKYRPSATESESRKHNIKNNDTTNTNTTSNSNKPVHTVGRNNHNKLNLQISINNSNNNTNNNTLNTHHNHYKHHIISKTNVDDISINKPLFTNYNNNSKRNKYIPQINIIDINTNSKPKHTVTLTAPSSYLQGQQLSNTLVANKPKKKESHILQTHNHLINPTTTITTTNNTNNVHSKTRRNLQLQPNKIVLHPRQHHPPQSTMNRKVIQLTVDSLDNNKYHRNKNNNKYLNELYQHSVQKQQHMKLPTIKIGNDVKHNNHQHNHKQQLILFKPYNGKNNVKVSPEVEGLLKIGGKKHKGLKVKDIVSLIKK